MKTVTKQAMVDNGSRSLPALRLVISFRSCNHFRSLVVVVVYASDMMCI